MNKYEKATLNPKTPENSKILLENLSEENCRKYCEEDGNCFDCYINFEQVQALDFIREENERLQKENEMLKLDSKNTYETSQDIMYEMQEENESLGDSVNKASKLLRKKEIKIKELNTILTDFEKWLEEQINNITNTYSQINGNYMRMQPILDTFKECLDKLQELKEGNK